MRCSDHIAKELRYFAKEYVAADLKFERMMKAFGASCKREGLSETEALEAAREILSATEPTHDFDMFFGEVLKGWLNAG